MVQNSAFNVADGDWYVPSVTYDSSHPTADLGDWVGLGGWYTTSALWQAGTYWHPDTRSWTAFYEDLNSNQSCCKASYMFGVNSNDHMSAQIDYNQTYAGQSYFFIEDLSTGHFNSNHVSFQPDTSTAEWMEDSSLCSFGMWRSFANFGVATWDHAAAGYGYQTLEGISYWVTEVEVYSTDPHGQERASPAGLGLDGQSFQDVWQTAEYSTC